MDIAEKTIDMTTRLFAEEDALNKAILDEGTEKIAAAYLAFRKELHILLDFHLTVQRQAISRMREASAIIGLEAGE